MTLEISISSSAIPEAPSSSSSSKSPSSVVLSPSVDRLWRAAAQRNLRNQWSKLVSFTREWDSISSSGRSHATDLVNAYLSRTYMPDMDLGVLSEMEGIRSKACSKLLKEQEKSENKLVSSYSEMIIVLKNMVEASKSMRSFKKSKTGERIIQFSSTFEGADEGDRGDCDGISVFVSWNVCFFEKLAFELVHMYLLEIKVKRIVLFELISLGKDEGFCWETEVYIGEFDDLQEFVMFLGGGEEYMCNGFDGERKRVPRRDVLEFNLAAWLVECCVDTHRVEEIFVSVGEEMSIKIL